MSKGYNHKEDCKCKLCLGETSFKKGYDIRRTNGFKKGNKLFVREKNHLFGKKRNCPWVSKRNKKLIKELNPAWRGGISFEPYNENFNNFFKLQIRQRDNYTCQLCDKQNKSLCVHHIDYDKKNTCKENCISLCRSCHGLTSNNRELWKLFFQDMLNYKYNYSIGNIMFTIIPEEQIENPTLTKIKEMINTIT